MDLKSNVTRSPAHLRTLQDQLFRAAAIHAYRNVPFYRRVWDEAGIDVQSIRGIQDLDRIPIITAPMVREAAKLGDLRARGVDPSSCTYLDTSGSSGVALRVWKRPLEERVRRAVGLRIWFEHGFRWRHHTAQFQIKPGPSHMLQRFGISRKTWISTERSIEDQLAQLLEAKPDVVVGTATALRRIARASEAAQVILKRPLVVFCAGELVDVETRQLVTRVFGREPVGLYGQTEVGYIAWQCEHRGSFHVNADTHFVEVLRDGIPAHPGELGTIVVTDLRARTMPLIRYNTADLAIAASGGCSCGRQLPLMGSIEGRERASILLGDGRLLTTRKILDHLAGTLRLGEFRLYQESLKKFRLELTCHALVGHPGIENVDTDSHVHLTVLGHLRKLLGEVDLSIRIVKPWPADGTGKTHAIFRGGNLNEGSLRATTGTAS
jgi:phenylacetate-coenzyme A ligase PaaK-like adenylate-forming protein